MTRNRMSKAQARRFEEALAELARQKRPANITPRLWRAQRDAAGRDFLENPGTNRRTLSIFRASSLMIPWSG